jgi:dipeptide/tripeptide permease
MVQSVPHDLATSTIMMAILFGTNTLFYLLFQQIKLSNSIHQHRLIDNNNSTTISHDPSHTHAVDDPKKSKNAVAKVEKELSKPFDGSLDSFTNLTSELFKVGLILLLTYICENHWIFEHSGKEYSRDLFFFVLIIFFGYAYYTIQPNHDLTLLSREQTEEWKGWMQFIFLLYHYFHAEEVYNRLVEVYP